MKLIVAFASLATVALASSAQAAGAGNAAAGKDIFSRTCQNCHSTEIGVNKVGPTLWNIVGRKVASIPDYNYSPAMKAETGTWTAQMLDSYLADPRGDKHGVKMFFKGLPGAQDRANVIAYLNTLK
ncbi:MAG TPA: c-type cytochrome [Beijerinckiaceae bacterium]|nr:c-type cytochrome [Rhodoblastus sp.]MCB9999074.1 c-type cytochrome [Methylobacteriaceae bacterium]MCC0002501.1 c-type cytochrome [Methylobacteriaceae bacterium]MCO5086945.1 c-type cytochrome [Methylobacteriaceae bacterium]HRY04538.1 c-type cytochrome [Beijerinckiaceae bacterium]